MTRTYSGKTVGVLLAAVGAAFLIGTQTYRFSPGFRERMAKQIAQATQMYTAEGNVSFAAYGPKGRRMNPSDVTRLVASESGEPFGESEDGTVYLVAFDTDGNPIDIEGSAFGTTTTVRRTADTTTSNWEVYVDPRTGERFTAFRSAQTTSADGNTGIPEGEEATVTTATVRWAGDTSVTSTDYTSGGVRGDYSAATRLRDGKVEQVVVNVYQGPEGGPVEEEPEEPTDEQEEDRPKRSLGRTLGTPFRAIGRVFRRKKADDNEQAEEDAE